MELEHYASEPRVLEPRGYDQSTANERAIGKPDGLWVSVRGEDDWVSWCRAEQFAVERLVYRHRVNLLPGANVLILESIPAIRDFSNKYPFYAKDANAGVRDILSRMNKDWERVAADHDGIIIAPYQWSIRLHEDYSWYYGWDCASGCIWNTDILSVGPGELVKC